MNTLTSHPPADPPATTPVCPTRAAVPVVPADALRRLAPAAATAVLGVAALTVAVGLPAGRHDWWPGFAAAFVIASASAAASVAVLSTGRGRTVDWLVTLTMAATVARLAVSGAGLLIAIKVLGTPPGVTAAAVGAYYVATLVAETNLLTRAAAPRPDVGGTHV